VREASLSICVSHRFSRLVAPLRLFSRSCFSFIAYRIRNIIPHSPMYASTAIHPITLTLVVTIAAPSHALIDTTSEVLLVSTEQKQRYKL
jgi:hypothetical protein